MTILLEKISVAVAGLALLLTTYLTGVSSGVNTDKALGGAPSGLYPLTATSSIVAVGPQENLLLWNYNVASSTPCASRIISTTEKPIMLSFGDRPGQPAGNRSTTTVGWNRGHWQGASTTVAYDGEIYGCGNVAAYGFDATSTITITEFR